MRRHGFSLSLLLLLLAACGLPEVESHGLQVETLSSEPRGEPVAIGQAAPLGMWVATIDGTWRRKLGDAAAETGRGRLVLEQQTTPALDGRATSRIVLHVLDPEGIAAEILGPLDGVTLRVDRDAGGRVLPASLRFEAAGPPGSEVFFDGLMFAGFGTGRPWTPPRAVRVGEAWPRRELGTDPRGLRTWGLSGATLATHGGGKLLAADDAGLQVALDALSEVQGIVHLQRAPSRNVSFGVRTRGEATLDPVTGQPRRWEAVTTIRYRGDDGAGLKKIEFEERIVGTVAPRASADGDAK